MNIEYRNAKIEEIDQIYNLQKKYHIDTISEEDKKDGFVTTLFTKEQFKSLIEKEQGLHIALDNGKVIAYAMAASWDYWKDWPLFSYMIENLSKDRFNGETLNAYNSYQYGPIAIDKPYRGGEVLKGLFNYSLNQMKDRYKIMVTFLSPNNRRSLKAHRDKLKMDIIKTFNFNNKEYYELAIYTDTNND